MVYSSEQIRLRPTTEADLDYVVAAEKADENSPYVGQWTREQHQAAFDDQSILHLIIEDIADNRTVGYVIITELNDPNEAIGLKRIVVTEKGRGYGRDTVRLVIKLAFEEWKAHRLWLDVIDHNVRARHVYEAEGFVLEGIVRECIKNGDRYDSWVLMGILRREYEALKLKGK